MDNKYALRRIFAAIKPVAPAGRNETPGMTDSISFARSGFTANRDYFTLST